MTATNHTEHYDLSQYTKDDRPTYTGDYNSDMSKIDAAIHAASQAGGMTAVEHTADLTGDGTTDSPLGVADTIARAEDIPSLDRYATTESVTQAIAAAIADRLTAGDIKPGNGINIETSGNQVTISYVGGGSAGGLSAVAHDTTLTGDGTSSAPLGAAIGSALNQGERDKELPDLDFNTYVSPGIYGIAANNVRNAPSEVSNAVRATLLVSGCGFTAEQNVILQVLFVRNTSSQDLGIYMRGLRSGTWDEWRRLASMDNIPDVSALTSRIAALESQVAALTTAATPGAVGLTAEQLDSQYLDGYNIVRVGTPTLQNETEVPSHE